MNPTERALEFDTIRRMLQELALCERAKERLGALAPTLDEAECRRRLAQTSDARAVLDACGAPPLVPMQDVEKTLSLCAAGAMLLPGQLTQLARFSVACERMRAYLAHAAGGASFVAGYGGSMGGLRDLAEEIERCIRGEEIESSASPQLRDLRRRLEGVRAQIQSKLASIVQTRRAQLTDGTIVMRGGRFALPVRRECKGQFAGSVLDVSGSGSTVFMEPAAVGKLQEQANELMMEEEAEKRRILYTLTALVEEAAATFRLNMQAMEELDFVFAKAKLSQAMDAREPEITLERRIRLRGARHPLLDKAACVPLDFEMADGTRGVIVTGPNTGGKTVMLKTVGLLSMMAQSGLHVPAGEGSALCMHSAYLCDVGDGQSIAENLSTFSAHMTNIIDILRRSGRESLVLLDELGSGTDPAEGMGIAVAVLEELRLCGCMLVATTHYPEVKAYAQRAEGFVNARMAFDRESLRPTYVLEIGQAGESCALYIARRLGLPERVLRRAGQAAYGGGRGTAKGRPEAEPRPGAEEEKGDAPRLGAEEGPGDTPRLGADEGKGGAPRPGAEPWPGDTPRSGAELRLKRENAPRAQSAHALSFGVGDSVRVYPGGETGIVYQAANARGEIGVQVKGRKALYPHKRVKRIASASEMYPEDYDFSIVFDTVENRKARRILEKRYDPSAQVRYDGEE